MEDEIEGTSKAQFEAEHYTCPFIHDQKECRQNECTHFSRSQHVSYWDDEGWSKGTYFSDNATCSAGTQTSLWSIRLKKPILKQKKPNVGFWQRIFFGDMEVKKYDEKQIYTMLETWMGKTQSI